MAEKAAEFRQKGGKIDLEAGEVGALPSIVIASAARRPEERDFSLEGA